MPELRSRSTGKTGTIITQTPVDGGVGYPQ